MELFILRSRIRIAVITIFFFSCQQRAPVLSTDIVIETYYGKIKIHLYSNTKQHKERIKELISNGLMDTMCVKQIEDSGFVVFRDTSFVNLPDSIFKIANEINYDNFHKKGAVIANKKHEFEDPARNSYLNEFFIITGKKYSEKELDSLEGDINSRLIDIFILNYLHKDENKWINEFAKQNFNAISRDSLEFTLQNIRAKAIKEWTGEHIPFKYSKKMREAYKNSGGRADFDVQYTVIGEVIEGMNILDSLLLHQQVIMGKESQSLP